MKLTDILDENSIAPELHASDKEGIIKELTSFMASVGKISSTSVPELTQAVIDREEHGSTAIGEGIAVPHTRHS